MKDLRLIVAAAAFVFSIGSVNAQEEIASIEEGTITENVVAVQGYKVIEVSALPEEVMAALSKDFEGATIIEAFKDDNDHFKLIISIGDESKAVYANAAGEWIESNE